MNEVVVEKDNENIFIDRGDILIRSGENEPYILSVIGKEGGDVHYVLISLVSGNRWSDEPIIRKTSEGITIGDIEKEYPSFNIAKVIKNAHISIRGNVVYRR